MPYETLYYKKVTWDFKWPFDGELKTIPVKLQMLSF